MSRPLADSPGRGPVREDAHVTAVPRRIAPVRGCQRCGRPLSRYNREDLCGACSVGTGGVQAAARTGDIGARLRALRRQRGMSLEVLGGLCGVSAAYLSMVENGKRGLDRWSMILALARALKVLPAELALESTTDPVDDPLGDVYALGSAYPR
jgi:DNA-binding XRE family transcriptional regulator